MVRQAHHQKIEAVLPSIQKRTAEPSEKAGHAPEAQTRHLTHSILQRANPLYSEPAIASMNTVFYELWKEHVQLADYSWRKAWENVALPSLMGREWEGRFRPHRFRNPLPLTPSTKEGETRNANPLKTPKNR